MSSNQDNPEKKKKDVTSHSEDNQTLSSRTDKKKAKIPKFEEKDMYRIRYDF